MDHRKAYMKSVVISIVGNMYSGKSSDALRRTVGYYFAGRRPVFLKYAKDDERLESDGKREEEQEEQECNDSEMADERSGGKRPNLRNRDRAVVFTHEGSDKIAILDKKHGVRIPVEAVEGKLLLDHDLFKPFILSERDALYRTGLDDDRPDPQSLLRYNVIVIDEAQFYDDLEEFCKAILRSSVSRGYPIVLIVAGLLSDFKGEKFGHVSDIMYLADDIIQLKAYCYCCGEECAFNDRKGFREEPVEKIGGADIYYPICRTCRDQMRYLVCQGWMN